MIRLTDVDENSIVDVDPTKIIAIEAVADRIITEPEKKLTFIQMVFGSREYKNVTYSRLRMPYGIPDYLVRESPDQIAELRKKLT